jgi:hypothetical protein
MRARTVIAALGRLGDAADTGATAIAWFTDLRFGPALERILGAAGRTDAPEAVHRTWLLLRLPSPAVAVPKAVARTGRSKAPLSAATAIASGWLADDDLRTFLGVHDAGGTTWLRAEPLATLAAWTLALAEPEGGDTTIAVALDRVVGAAAEAGYALDGWLASMGGGRGSPATAPPKALEQKAPRKAPTKKPAGAVKRARSPRGR